MEDLKIDIKKKKIHPCVTAHLLQFLARKIWYSVKKQIKSIPMFNKNNFLLWHINKLIVYLLLYIRNTHFRSIWSVVLDNHCGLPGTMQSLLSVDFRRTLESLGPSYRAVEVVELSRKWSAEKVRRGITAIAATTATTPRTLASRGGRNEQWQNN